MLWIIIIGAILITAIIGIILYSVMLSNFENGTDKIKRSLLEVITVMASQYEAIVVMDGQLLVDGGNWGLNIVVINRKPLFVKQIKSFNICCSKSEIQKLSQFIDYKISYDDLVIVASRGNPFELAIRNSDANDILIESLRKIGMRKQEFTDHSNYVLLGSKKKDLYVEMLSDTIAYHPQFEIKKVLCRQNPFSIYPPKKYLFFDEKVPKEETIIRCALERSARASPGLNPSKRNRFGMVDDKCVVVNDDDIKTINQAKDVDNCMSGLGTKGGVSLYEVAPMSEPVTIYDRPNYRGGVRYVAWGEIKINEEIFAESMKIPDRYYVHFVYKPNILRTLYGPMDVPLIEDNVNGNPLDLIAISRHENNNVIFCDNDNCFTLAPGSYVLPPYLFLRIKSVLLSQYSQKVSIYSDISFRNLVQGFTESGVVTFPKIIRAVRIS